MNKIMFLFITFTSIIHANDSQYYAYVDLGYCRSIFDQFGTVIGLLDQYENNKYSGIKVESGFAKRGEYYSHYKNSNWWEWFFKKLDVGNTTGEFRSIPMYEKRILSNCLYELSFKRAHELIQKYIELQPEIKEKISAFQKAFFDDFFVIGVCYIEDDFSKFGVPKISYKTIYDMLLVHIVEKNNLKIFCIHRR